MVYNSEEVKDPSFIILEDDVLSKIVFKKSDGSTLVVPLAELGDVEAVKSALTGAFVQTPDGAPIIAGTVVTHNADEFAGNFGNIQATVRKLADTGATGDVKVLGCGDSTASLMLNRLMLLVQALYPHRSLRRYTWNDTTKVYGAPSTIVVGSGATFIDFYDSGVGGARFESFMGAQFESQIAAVQPDLMIIHFGHNYGAAPNPSAEGGAGDTEASMDAKHLERSKRFILRVKDTCPTADIMLNSQNPYLTAGARDGISNVRAQAYRSICAALGCAYGPVLEAFLATGEPTTYLEADLLHPTTSGSQLGAEALFPQFRVSEVALVGVRVASPLLVPGKQMLSNADLTAFDSPPMLTDWFTNRATITKETGVGLFESKGYSVKIVPTEANTGSIYQSLPIDLVRGRVVTVAARVYVPAATSGLYAGRIQIAGNGGIVTALSSEMATLKGVWAWVFATTRIPEAATVATVYVYGGNITTDITYVDRVSVVVGDYPRDVSSSVSAAASSALVVDVFTESGTWTKRAGVTAVDVYVIAGGGGGGSGRRDATGTVRCGGGGGGGGGLTRRLITGAFLGATEPVIVGTGGLGGAAVTTDATNGNAGSNGTASQFGALALTARANTGTGGGGGTNSGGTAGTGNSGGSNSGGFGGAAQGAGGVGAAGAIGVPAYGSATGGGAGGGLTTGDVETAGGAGGNTGLINPGAAGASNGGAGGNGGSTSSNNPAGGAGGGGGGSNVGGVGGTGGNGGLYGAGGGGGGASDNGNASGAGGNGAAGIVVVVNYF